jgi:hypothetical protein
VAALRAAAAFRAVAEHRGDSLELSLDPGARPRPGAWLVHLAERPVPAAYHDSLRAGAIVLASCCDSSAAEVAARRIGQGLLLTVPALGDPPLGAEFPELMASLWPDPERLSPADAAPRRMSATQLLPAFIDAEVPEPSRELPMKQVLLLLAVILFLLERWLSHRHPAEAG